MVDALISPQTVAAQPGRTACPTRPSVLQLNQLPGAAAFASKSDLAQASGPLPFLPKSFALPEQAAAYKEFADSNPDVEWLVKGGMHRGVRHVSSQQQALDVAEAEPTEAFAQQLVRPYLIDGCASAICSLQQAALPCHPNIVLLSPLPPSHIF